MAGESDPTPITTLYWLEDSRAQRILWLLEELGVPYDVKCFKRGKDMFADPALKDIHPLGKSPVVTLKTANSEQETVLAESGPIVEYLIDHFGPHMIPPRYKEGAAPSPCAETEEWLRDRYFMHYSEGSLMPLLIVALVMKNIRNGPVPFFIKPVTRMIVSKVEEIFLKHNFETQLNFLNQQVKSSPGGGRYLCGDRLTGSDIMMSYPLEDAVALNILTKDRYPELFAYLERLHEHPAYQRAEAKIREIQP